MSDKQEPAEQQKFQDILLTSCTPECLEIGIVPHLKVFLSPVDVASLMSLMRIASSENASYKDCNSFDKENGISVERIKDANVIRIGHGIIEVGDLTDFQWASLYSAFSDWQLWSAGGGNRHRRN